MTLKKLILISLFLTVNRSSAQNFHLELVDIIVDSGMHSVTRGYDSPNDAIFKIDGDLLYVLDAGYDQKGKEMCSVSEFSMLRLLIYDLRRTRLETVKFIEFNTPIWLPSDMVIIGDDFYLLTDREFILFNKASLFSTSKIVEEFRYLTRFYGLGNFGRIEVIDDSNLYLLNDFGDNFKSDSVVKSGFVIFNTRTKLFSRFNTIDIPGLTFSCYVRHVFITSVSGGRIVANNGYDYTLSMYDGQTNLLTTQNASISDSSWYRIDSVGFDEFRNQNQFNFDLMSILKVVEKKDHVERIFKTSPLSDSIYVLTTRHTVVSSERKYSIDLWKVNENNEFVLLAKDVLAYPIPSKRSVDNRSHYYRWSCQFLMTPDYLIMYKNEVYSLELKRMLTSTKKINAKKFNKEHKKIKQTTQPVPCIYVYKIVND